MSERMGGRFNYVLLFWVLAVVSLPIYCLTQQSGKEPWYKRITVDFRVVDRNGNPIKDALVSGYFTDVSAKGYSLEFYKLTPENGTVSVSGKAQENVMVTVNAYHYYSYENENIVSYDQIYSPSNRHGVTITLDEIRNPIPMYQSIMPEGNVGTFFGGGRYPDVTSFYPTNEVASFDFVKGDWLPPFGSGEIPDMVIDWCVTNVLSRGNFDFCYTLYMTNGVADGIIRTNANGQAITYNNGSGLTGGYNAPLDGYTNRYCFAKTVRERRALSTNIGTNDAFYIRIRSRTGAGGEILGQYGKILNCIGLSKCWYYLNPNVGDTNVEADHKKNLSDRGIGADPLIYAMGFPKRETQEYLMKLGYTGPTGWARIPTNQQNTVTN